MKKIHIIKKIDTFVEKIKSKLNKLNGLSKKIDKTGTLYRGNSNTTVDGIPCMNWTSNKNSFSNLAKNKRLGLGNHNFCRNPDPKNKKDIWCYTDYQFTNKKWGYCSRKYAGYKINEIIFLLSIFLLVLIILYILYRIFSAPQKKTYRDYNVFVGKNRLIFDPDSSIGFDGIEY